MKPFKTVCAIVFTLNAQPERQRQAAAPAGSHCKCVFIIICHMSLHILILKNKIIFTHIRYLVLRARAPNVLFSFSFSFHEIACSR